MNIDELTQKLLENRKFKKAYYKKDLAFEIGEMITEARIAKGMSQEKLALIMSTKQPSIARAENGNCLPSLNFLERIAKAFNTELLPPKFAFLEEKNKTLNENIEREAFNSPLHFMVIKDNKNISMSESPQHEPSYAV